jgi:hypothetical protein
MADSPGLELSFADEPIERGLQLGREGGELVTLEVDGRTSRAWASHSSPTTPGMGWMRSVRLRVTDPAFQNGGMPVCDVEIEYLLDAWSGVEVFADTHRGGVRVAGGWGGDRRWKTLRFQLDDARFARGDTGDGSRLNSNAHDLIIYGANAPLHIRAVRIRGYDLDHDPDYRRLLRLDGYTTGESAELMLFQPDRQPAVRYSVTNLARKPLDATYRWALRHRNGQLLARGEQDVTLDAASQTDMPVTLDTTGLAYGVYSLTFELMRRGDTEPILQRESYLGVIDGRAVPKAEPGEFLYGLDVTLGPAYGSSELLQWTRHMGVDIIRHGFGPGTVEEVIRHLPTYEDFGLQVLFMCDPPKDQNRRAEELPGVLDKLESIASRFPQIRYYELGNEPDLTFFYPGPIAHYVEDYHQMYDAIKRGNPDAVVMNGGLCFAGADATRRAEEFVRLVDPDRIDAFAYHGHGPGAAAEREALERMRAVAERHGKGHLPLIETESGVAARSPAQEDVQARTVVQKMTYAQSEAMPLFIWFRLLMFEEAYGNLRTPQEPRPAVLAYRHMVQRLRGHAWHAQLAQSDRVEGHLFHQRLGLGRVAVLWSQDAAADHVVLQLARRAIAGAQVFDLYGNATPLSVSSDGLVGLEVGADPLYVVWTADDGDFLAHRLDDLIDSPPSLGLADGLPTVLPVTVRNPFEQPLQATLRARMVAAEGQVEPQTVPCEVLPGGSATLPLTLTYRHPVDALAWPQVWTAYLHVIQNIELSSITDIPDTLPGPAGPVAAQPARPREGVIDFERLGGQMREREAAVLLAHVDSPIDQVVRVGASADWWMAWTVNGQPVYDTLDAGNGGGYALTDHTFDLPLRAGQNLLAIKVLSGSMGWKVLMGSPDDLLWRQHPERQPRVELTLQDRDGRSIFRRAVGLERIAPLPWLADGMSMDSPLNAWRLEPSQIILDEKTLENPHHLHPDASRWWQGEHDLSGEGWLRQDGRAVILVLAVRDDHDVSAGRDASDQLRIRLSPHNGDDPSHVLQWTPDHVEYANAQPGVAMARQRIEKDQGGVTVYRARIELPADSLAGPWKLALELIDTDDGREIKQAMRWGDADQQGVIILRQP